MSPNLKIRGRRPHTKSRNGCARCKRLRRKCDERLPRCSRCTDLDKECQYPNDGGNSESRSSSGPRLRENEPAPVEAHHLTVPSVGLNNSRAVSRGPSTAASPLTRNPTTVSPAFTSDASQAGTAATLSTHLLNARDLELLGHYLSHTSRSVAYDRDDLYALHVGIPNLAFGSKALMSSMLAVAAACQCHDLLEVEASSGMSGSGLGSGLDVPRIRELLVVAEQHHAASLRQIQEDIPSTDQYDHVLANAVLMVLYGSSSHWVRIRLMEAFEAGSSSGAGDQMGRLPEEFVPVRSQWMSLIRAVHIAYVSLLDGQAQNAGSKGAMECKRSSPSRLDFGDVDVVCPENGPTYETKRLFLPILATTSGPALSKLYARARRVERNTEVNDIDFEACMKALAVFESILGETFPEKTHSGFSPETPGSQIEDKGEPVYLHSLGRLSNVAPWLRGYTARVTMNSRDSRPLRRTINAFINRVPTTYLHIVQAKLEHIPVHKSQDSTTETDDAGDDPVHWLAMDIFAHWLVLVVLLDGVWWIGGIGAWELGGVVKYMRDEGRVGGGDEDQSEAWWPESMYNIRMELKRHLAK